MRRNEQIRISPIRLIGEDGAMMGVYSNDEAQRMARDAGMDLVEVAPNVRPPVCRIMDYGKWKYLQKKKTTKSSEQLFKEVRLRPKTDDHDLEIKLKHACTFFAKGAKVQFTMRFRGRERAHREVAFSVLRQVVAFYGDKVKVERPPSMDGRNMVMVLSPLKGGFDKVAKTGAESAPAGKPSVGVETAQAGQPKSGPEPATGPADMANLLPPIESAEAVTDMVPPAAPPPVLHGNGAWPTMASQPTDLQ